MKSIVCIGLLLIAGFSHAQMIDTPLEKGSLINGQKEGVWEYFDKPGELGLKIDYSLKKLLYIKPDTSKFLTLFDTTWIEQKLSIPPRYLGSYKTWYNHIETALHYPKVARQKKITGLCLLLFQIGLDGKAISPKILQDPGHGIGESVIEAFNTLPNMWIVGANYKGPKKTCLILPIYYSIGEQNLNEQRNIPYSLPPIYVVATEPEKNPSSKTTNFKIKGKQEIPKSHSYNLFWSLDGKTIFLERSEKGINHLYSVNTDQSNPVKISLGKDNHHDAACDADGNIYFSISEQNDPEKIYRFDVARHQAEPISIVADYHPLPNPVNDQVAFHSRRNGVNQIYIYDASTKEKHHLENQGYESNRPLSWSHNGRYLAYRHDASEYDDIRVVDFKNSEKINILPLLNVRFCGWSHDDNKILVVKTESERYNIKSIGRPIENQVLVRYSPDVMSQFFLININTLDIEQLTPKLVTVYTGALSPAGDEATLILDGKLFIMDLTTRKRYKLINDVFVHKWSPDGKRIAFIKHSSHQVYIVDRDGGNIKQLTNFK